MSIVAASQIASNRAAEICKDKKVRDAVNKAAETAADVAATTYTGNPIAGRAARVGVSEVAKRDPNLVAEPVVASLLAVGAVVVGPPLLAVAGLVALGKKAASVFD